MSDWVQIGGVIVLFVIGLRLSAFFSGNEIGFYRLSLPRLGIDAQSGDREASRLLWFAHRPGHFVATTLVGNNVANYVVTLAVTHGTVLASGGGSEMAEVAATLAVSPVIFLFGELLPKNVYYRAPRARMRRQIKWLQFFYYVALPASAPLVVLTRFVERLSGQQTSRHEMLPGRGRFLQMISHGHREGLLSHAQSTMATGVLAIAAQRVSASMIPSSRVLGLPENSTTEAVLEFARQYGAPVVTLAAAGPDVNAAGESLPRWTSYVRVGDLRVLDKPLAACQRRMPQIPWHATKLEALSTLHDHSAAFGAVVDDDGSVLGTISQRGLVEQLFRPSLRGQDAVIAE